MKNKTTKVLLALVIMALGIYIMSQAKYLAGDVKPAKSEAVVNLERQNALDAARLERLKDHE